MKLRHSVLGGAAVAMGGALATLVYAGRVEPYAIQVSNLHLSMDGLAAPFDGYRIAQISDIHMQKDGVGRGRLERAVEMINELQPDVIAMTGDFVTNASTFDPGDLIEPLRLLVARDAKIAVTGNHDHGGRHGLVRRVIRDSGFIHLDNTVHTVKRGEARLYFAGVGSVLRHDARLDVVLRELPPAGTAILLAHEPDFFDVSAATKRFRLQLSGHSHGGQVRIPMLTRYVLPAHSTRYIQGAYFARNCLLYVNRGLGTVGLPFRFNCPPEIAVFQLSTLRE